MSTLPFKSLKALPKEELFAPGHRACSGCLEALAVRLALKAVGPNAIVISATGCMEVISSYYPYTSWAVPWYHVAFENSAAVASGVEGALKVLQRKNRIKKEKIHVISLAGDGGTVDIGLQALSGALERGHDFVHICTDNEAYMNTGIQRSGATPFGAWTSTTETGRVMTGKIQWKKDMPSIAAAHKIPYVATATPAYPVDYVNKVKKAIDIEGPAYVHVYATCPPGWRMPSHLSVKVARLGVQTGIFPIYEVTNGELTVTIKVPRRKHVRNYLMMQRRFTHLSKENIAIIQERIDKESEKIGLGPRVEE